MIVVGVHGMDGSPPEPIAGNWTKQLIQGLSVIAGCLLVFALADYLHTKVPDFQGLWSAVKAISLAILPAVIVALYDRRRTIEDVSKLLAGRFQEQLEYVIVGREKYGLVGFLPTLSYVKLVRDLRVGDELLWLDTYPPSYREFIDELGPAINRGVKIRMLVIDDTSDNAKYRAEEIKAPTTSKYFIQEAHEFRNRLIDVINEPPILSENTNGTLEVRIYKDLPSIPMYIILHNGTLSHGYCSLFLAQPTFQFVHFEWKYTEDGLLKDMREYFERKWYAQERPGRGQVLMPSSERGKYGE